MLSGIASGLWLVAKMFLSCFLFLIIPVVISILSFVCCTVYHYVHYRYVDHLIPMDKEMPPIKKPGMIKTLFYLAPKMYAYDKITFNPDEFKEHGIHMFVGRQGSGKSLTAVYVMQQWKQRYPECLFYTNMGYKYEDDELSHWKDIIDHKNGIYGVVNLIDDIKAWWSNRDSKDLPPAVLADICQQRKQRKATLCTIQVFSEAPKPFRSQVEFVYIPKTYLNCLTIVRKSRPEYYDAEKNIFKKYCGFFMFAHTKELRESYDTYKKIEKYKETEWDVSPYFMPQESSLPLAETPSAK